MMNEKLHTGFAIAIAWPETYCKQPGSWYDPITLVLGINKNHYYKVGHAALVLINSIEKKCHYFDFGRYHSPFQHGRVRGANTDHDLIMNTIPVISKNKERIENFREILIELQNNKACHGEGEIHASYSSINFKKALHKVIQMQNAKSIAYGPFRIKGSNCSRFVNTAIIAGKPQLKHRFKLKYFNPLSPTPKSNVKALHNYLIIEKKLSNKPFQPLKPLPKNLLKVTLNPPKRNNSIPANAQWLSGEGAGSCAGPGDAARSAQPSPVPAPAVSGGHRGVVAGRHRLSDPGGAAASAQRPGVDGRGRGHRCAGQARGAARRRIVL